MELSLHNVGIIRESKVKLDGLTVITGKNSSGKTTVGKVIYSLIAAGSDPVAAFDESRRGYICGQLREVENSLRLRRARQMRQRDIKLLGQHEDVIRTLVMHRFDRFDIDELMVFLMETKLFVEELTQEAYMQYFLLDEKGSSIAPNNFYRTVSDKPLVIRVVQKSLWR